MLFGFDCPSCGIQRSLFCLVNGDLLDSICYFPSLILFLIAFFILAINYLFFKKPSIYYHFASKLGSFAAWIQIGYYTLRMLQILPSLDRL